MTTKLIAIDTDTHAVVPREPTDEMVKYVQDELYDELYSARWIYKDMISKAPQLTTPSVLRWEGNSLMVGNKEVCYLWDVVDPRFIESDAEARRTAEKALGFPDGLVVDEL